MEISSKSLKEEDNEKEKENARIQIDEALPWPFGCIHCDQIRRHVHGGWLRR